MSIASVTKKHEGSSDRTFISNYIIHLVASICGLILEFIGEIFSD